MGQEVLSWIGKCCKTVRVKTKEEPHILGILTYFLLWSFHYLILCVTLGKATLSRSPRFPPSSSSSSLPSTSSSLRGVLSHCDLTSSIKWKRFRLPGSQIMHIKTTKCNHFCLVASVTNQEVFNHPEVQVRQVCSDYGELTFHWGFCCLFLSPKKSNNSQVHGNVCIFMCCSWLHNTCKYFQYSYEQISQWWYWIPVRKWARCDVIVM